MPRKQGDGKGKFGGRQKGTPNKDKTYLKTAIRAFVEEKTEEMFDLWGSLKAKEKVDLYLALMRYVVAPAVAEPPAKDDDIDKRGVIEKTVEMDATVNKQAS
jgi:hypothetical protein